MKYLQYVKFVGMLPAPYSTQELSVGSPDAPRHLRLEVIPAEESVLGVPSVRIRPLSQVARKMLEIPMTSVLCAEPLNKRLEQANVTIEEN